MNVAVFVDAGYLYALAALARFKQNYPRGRVSLNVEAVVHELKREVAALDGGANRLIRIYWYDGAPLAGRTPEQTRTAALPDVKLRLGSVNAYGQQKGVDALIVHDMSELARNRAVDAMLVVSGDEDLLVGVQTAQTFGVRVHLLGVDPYHTQAERLRFEADVAHEWPEGLVGAWISLRPLPRDAKPDDGTPAIEPPDGVAELIAAGGPVDAEQMTAIVADIVPGIVDRVPAIVANWDRYRRIPVDVNTRLMKASSQALGRPIDASERIAVRSLFVDLLRRTGPDGRIQELPASPEAAPAEEEEAGTLDGADGDALLAGEPGTEAALDSGAETESPDGAGTHEEGGAQEQSAPYGERAGGASSRIVGTPAGGAEPAAER